MDNFGVKELDELLEEKVFVQEILFPSVILIQNEDRAEPGINYNFANAQKFKGRVDNNKMISGIYSWPNGQEYRGSFNSNNNLNKGEIIFPNNNKLISTYDESRETFKRCIYVADSYIYEGNIKRNKFNGFASIENKENENLYSFRGKYDEGKRKGRCEIITMKNDIKYKINGSYRDGKKNGNF